MTTGPPPNYYAILEIADNASTQQIRDAYKRGALKTHPDRVPAESPERAQRTRKFQLVNDAYFTLSDATRRRDYDAQRKLFGYGGKGTSYGSTPADPFAEEGTGTDDAGPPPAAGGGGGGPSAAQSAYSWAWNYFTKQDPNPGTAGRTPEQAQSEQFGDVFEEMLREEGLSDNNNQPNGRFWGLVGGASGGALGFIVANVPGLLAGAVAGNRLGAVRDTRGKSVYAVFQELPQSDKSRLLSQLAAKVFSHAVGI